MKRFSRIIAGMWRLSDWQITPGELVEFVESCIDIGVTSFDHADIYGEYTCEHIFGEAIALKPSLRDRIQLITKCGIKLVSENRPEHRIKQYDTSSQHIVASVENSLRCLWTDHVDLLLIHRPDPLMDAGEVAEAFSTLKTAGKVLAFGVSNFTASQYELLASRLDFPLITNQVEFSALELSPLTDGTLDQCQKLRIPPMAWSPFAGGRLFNDSSDQAQRIRAVLNSIGEELNLSGEQVALAWILSHPSRVYPVLGTGKIDRVHRAVEAAKVELSREQWFGVWQASTGTEVP
jgi:predicted oxidoreductase